MRWCSGPLLKSSDFAGPLRDASLSSRSCSVRRPSCTASLPRLRAEGAEEVVPLSSVANSISMTLAPRRPTTSRMASAMLSCRMPVARLSTTLTKIRMMTPSSPNTVASPHRQRRRSTSGIGQEPYPAPWPWPHPARCVDRHEQSRGASGRRVRQCV